MTAATTASLLETARALAPTIRACRDQIESERRLPLPLVQAMTEAGLFRMLTPTQFGGGEVELPTAMRVFEELARADGAAGWCAMIGNTGIVGGYVPEEAAEEIYGGDPNVITGGALAPVGRAVVADGGYRVSGRWSFGSGCQHSTWLVGNCLLFDGDRPRLGPDGAPQARVMFFPAGDFEIIDTWSVGGLRGTGSHDFAVSDVFVPARRSLSLFDPPRHPGPLYAFPLIGLLAVIVAAVPLGIARAAIDALVELAGAKVPTGSRALLRERSMTQVQVAQAEALWRAGRALLYSTVEEVWDTVTSGREVSLELRASLRLAATHATVSATQAVDLMYNAGGASSIYTGNRLERAFRDIHTATQHVLVQPMTWEMTGRVLLGLDPGTQVF
jgi:alkylation response protein AidB-like acyl-CoA dehydrogenase